MPNLLAAWLNATARRPEPGDPAACLPDYSPRPLNRFSKADFEHSAHPRPPASLAQRTLRPDNAPEGAHMPTTDNLKAAFAGESQANRKYLAFAAKAAQDGLPQIARLFRAAAEAETIHAHAHLRVLQGVKSTTENLQAAIAGEAYEF